MLIASNPRYIQGRGEGWLCTGTTYGNPCGPVSALSTVGSNQKMPIVHGSSSVETFSIDGRRLAPTSRDLQHGIVIRRNQGAIIGVRALIH